LASQKEADRFATYIEGVRDRTGSMRLGRLPEQVNIGAEVCQHARWLRLLRLRDLRHRPRPLATDPRLLGVG